jgi:hypothetical protein
MIFEGLMGILFYRDLQEMLIGGVPEVTFV